MLADTNLRPFRDAAQRFLKDECPQLAAAISYYALFSVFPLIIFLTGMAGVLLQDSDTQDRVIEEVLKNIPFDEGEGRDSVSDAVRGVSHGGAAIGILGLLGMAWAGSAVFGAVRRALNIVFEDREWKRPFAQQKLVDLGMVLAVGLFFLSSIAATASLRVARAHTEQLAAWGQVEVLWDLASFLIPLALSFGAFLFLYAFIPARRRSLREIWPGALFAAALFEGAKISFSIYIEHFANYDVVYGSLGAVVAFMFWIYVSSNLMLLGAELAAAFARSPAVETTGKPATPRKPLRTTVSRFVRRLFVADRDDPGKAHERGHQR